MDAREGVFVALGQLEGRRVIFDPAGIIELEGNTPGGERTKVFYWLAEARSLANALNRYLPDLEAAAAARAEIQEREYAERLSRAQEKR